MFKESLMRRSLCGGLLVTAVLAWSAGSAAAQETGTPLFKSPYRMFTTHEFGAALSDPGSGVSYALEGFYRYASGPYDFSLRGGYEHLSSEVNGVATPCCSRYLLGGDFRTQVIKYSESVPLDGSLTLGFGANIGDGEDSYYIPIGLTVGRRFELEGSKTTFVPFAHPVLIPAFGGGGSRIDFALGLGVDVRLSQTFAIRASGGIGDIDGVGIGVSYIK
jgi:hypothetical protein